MEKKVRDAVAELLKLKPNTISVDADFFELGGNSLSAVQLSRRLNVFATGPISLPAIMGQPTIAGMAESIQFSTSMTACIHLTLTYNFTRRAAGTCGPMTMPARTPAVDTPTTHG